jgi:hypothetical protein
MQSLKICEVFKTRASCVAFWGSHSGIHVAVFWNIAPCSPCVNRRFGRTCLLLLWDGRSAEFSLMLHTGFLLVWIATLEMEVVRSSETSVYIWTTQSYIKRRNWFVLGTDKWFSFYCIRFMRRYDRKNNNAIWNERWKGFNYTGSPWPSFHFIINEICHSPLYQSLLLLLNILFEPFLKHIKVTLSTTTTYCYCRPYIFWSCLQWGHAKLLCPANRRMSGHWPSSGCN